MATFFVGCSPVCAHQINDFDSFARHLAPQLEIEHLGPAFLLVLKLLSPPILNAYESQMKFHAVLITSNNLITF